MSHAPPKLANPVKLVVWDLDETFWQGTLSEEGMTPIPENIALVKQLAHRGVISSICSKNDHAPTVAALLDLEVLSYFVLPSVSFQPKGTSIARIISALQLRPDNVVLVDDNPSVLAEAAYTCPGIVCLQSPAQLAALIDDPHLRGTPDPGLARLTQYQSLAARHDLRLTAAAGDDESFLRQSDIRIEIDYAIEDDLDRIVELANRSNQLNYTKRRIETEADRQRLLHDIQAYGFKTATVRVRDKYSDYGIVGFFMTLATLREYRLEHFVFSCRIMNMGVEQYVYAYLNRPAIDIAGPVANPIETFPVVDWIGEGPGSQAIAALRTSRLVLIGGCDMLQLSTYCSAISVEFTNRLENGLIKRLDDPFLVLDDPARVRQSALRPHVPAFNADEMVALATAAKDADLIVLSIYKMMEINYFRGIDGLTVRFDEDAVRDILKSDLGLWFVRNFAFVASSREQRYAIIRQFLGKLASWTKPRARIVVLLENTRKLQNNPSERQHREHYNAFIADACGEFGNVVHIDVNTATSIDWLFDDGFHMSRHGYFELAQAVNRMLDAGNDAPAADPPSVAGAAPG